MKRKADAQSSRGAISAVAARRTKQKLADEAVSPATAPPAPAPVNAGTPIAPKSSTAETEPKDIPDPKQAALLEIKNTSVAEQRNPSGSQSNGTPVQAASDQERPGETANNITFPDAESPTSASSSDTDNSSESRTALSQNWEDFLLSKSRLRKEDIVYDTYDVLCLRLQLKSTLVLVGQYDLLVKAGVVSILGAKLPATPRVYRVYAPCTHSLPVIKCVSGGVNGYAEVELRSCQNGLRRLENISDLYHRIWNGERTIPRKKLKCDGRASFSILYSASDDPFGRIIRPLHLDPKWSVAIKSLSQRGGQMSVLTCGPKGSGKSTFNKYLLNHLLSKPPSQDIGHPGKDGVAFLDLDPGQPEFSTAGHVYLAHMRNPVLGPPFAHPSADEQTNIRSHFIGGLSPKADSEHYVTAIMDLMDRFHHLRHRYPQCGLIINYPGWIFGQGLEIATWLVYSLGLSDVVYMSEKGPEEVVAPLGIAASQAGVPMTILPSQPTEYVNRSSSQLRSMQLLSYFHSCRVPGDENPIWTDIPLVRSRPLVVNYAGEKQGVFGIMVPGFSYEPDVLRDLLDGAIIGVVALESLDAIAAKGPSLGTDEQAITTSGSPDPERDTVMDAESGETATHTESDTVRTKEQLPYLFVGEGGTCVAPDPKLSYSLGLAIVRSINPDAQTIDLQTPIPTAAIRNALEQGHRIVFVRGQLDHPNWAISEEYFAARASQERHRRSEAAAAAAVPERTTNRRPQGKSMNSATTTTTTTQTLSAGETQKGDDDDDTAAKMRQRVRRAATVPWMQVSGWDVAGGGRTPKRRDKHRRLWKLRKKADPGVESA